MCLLAEDTASTTNTTLSTVRNNERREYGAVAAMITPVAADLGINDNAIAE